MKKLIFTLAVVLALSAACKPKEYLGPLASPLGNWHSSESIYYFNGETVYQNNSCEYSAISFYKDSLCCIEGRKGTFQYYMSETGDSLVIDSVAWHIKEMTGRLLKLDYLEDLRAKTEDTESSDEVADNGAEEDEGPIMLPVEYKGVTIDSDGAEGYMYTNSEGKEIPCRYVGHDGEDGILIIDCWFDSRSDAYKPF